MGDFEIKKKGGSQSEEEESQSTTRKSREPRGIWRHYE